MKKGWSIVAVVVVFGIAIGSTNILADSKDKKKVDLQSYSGIVSTIAMGNAMGEIEVTGDSGKRTFFCEMDQVPMGLKIGDRVKVTYRTTTSADTPYVTVKMKIEGKKLTCAPVVIAHDAVVKDGLVFHGKYPPASARDQQIWERYNKLDDLMRYNEKKQAKPIVKDLLQEIVNNSPTAASPEGDNYSVFMYEALKGWAKKLGLAVPKKQIGHR